MKTRSLLALLVLALLSLPAAALDTRVVQGRPTTLGSAVTGTGAQPSQPGVVFSTFQVTGSTSAGTGSATVYIQVSNDNVNWVTACTVTLSLSTSVSTDGCGVSVPWRYVRMYVNAISGTDAAVSATMGG